MATVPSQITWVVGQVVTAAQLNSNVRDAVNYLLAPPLFVGYQTVAQSITSGNWISINIDTEEIDRDNGHSTVSNTSRYTAQTAGWYLLDAVTAWVSNATGPRAARFTVNGTAKTGRLSYLPATGGGFATAVPLAGKVFLNVGDYAEVQGAQTSGVTLNTANASDMASYLSALWVSS